MRKKVIAGNWKMNKSVREAKHFIDEVSKKKPGNNVEAIICAPYVHLPSLVEKAKGTFLKISAQNMHEKDNGAYTGEVSPFMLKEIGVTHTIIGHSERRQYFNETDESVNEKAHAAFHHDITPIICVGEQLAEREGNVTDKVIEKQVTEALKGLSSEQIVNTIIAYEPIWAIGTGKTASTEDANNVCKQIRAIISEKENKEVAEKVIIQYGGSVKPENCKELLEQSDIDGALVGGASIEPESFMQLLEEAEK